MRVNRDNRPENTPSRPDSASLGVSKRLCLQLSLRSSSLEHLNSTFLFTLSFFSPPLGFKKIVPTPNAFLPAAAAGKRMIWQLFGLHQSKLPNESSLPYQEAWMYVFIHSFVHSFTSYMALRSTLLHFVHVTLLCRSIPPANPHFDPHMDAHTAPTAQRAP